MAGPGAASGARRLVLLLAGRRVVGSSGRGTWMDAWLPLTPHLASMLVSGNRMGRLRYDGAAAERRKRKRNTRKTSSNGCGRASRPRTAARLVVDGWAVAAGGPSTPDKQPAASSQQPAASSQQPAAASIGVPTAPQPDQTGRNSQRCTGRRQQQKERGRERARSDTVTA